MGDPVIPSEAEIVQCNMAFSEWTLFDFDMGNEMTPLKRAARQDPSLTEFSDTQFYSVFWVISTPAPGFQSPSFSPAFHIQMTLCTPLTFTISSKTRW